MSDETTAQEAEQAEETTEAATEQEAASSASEEQTPQTEETPAETSTEETQQETETTSADWRDSIEDKDLRELAERYATPQDMAKAVADFRKANAAMVKLPGKDATAEDIAKFHKAIGVPESPDGYEFSLPEGKEPTEQDQAFQSEMAKAMHEAGVPASAAKVLNEKWNEMVAAAEAEQERKAKESFEEAQAALKKEMGSDFEANVNLANRALRAFGGDELIRFLQDNKIGDQYLSDHPALVKAFAQVGRRMGEGDFIGAVGNDERQSIQDRIDEIMRQNPPGTDGYKSDAVQRELRELHEKLHGTTPVVGAAGRSA